MNNIFETKNLSRDFKVGNQTISVINGINLTISENKLTILKGRSGSGKSTLINLLGTLDSPTAGDILFQGKNLTSLCEKERDEIRRTELGFIFQSVALISLMTAFENVDLALRVAGFPEKERKERAQECLALVGLSKRMYHRTNELSGGEQQRVAIARAIAHKPKVVFADEPTAALDSHMGIQIMKLFKDLVHKEKVTLIMTTHDPNMMELADKVYTLEDGKITSEYVNTAEKVVLL